MKPIGIEESDFCENFNPSMLDSDNQEREQAREVVLRVLKKITDISNSSLHGNADALFCKIVTERIFCGLDNREFLKESLH